MTGTAINQIADIALIRPIGSGTTGVVYEAVREGSPVAVKVLHPSLTSDSRTVGRFVRERQLFGRISHPNVVQVFDLVVTNDQLGIVMEFVEGGSLLNEMRSTTITPVTALDLSVDIAQGLAEIHSNDIVHRDLKPANVLLDHKGQQLEPKIADFGLSRLLAEQTSSLSGAVGTPFYMSPEAANGSRLQKTVTK